jgi:type IX secretion system PorP/SprF family membrane protein
MKLRVGFYLLLFFVTQQSFSQEGVPVYTDYINDNYYLIHPSMAGASNCTKFRLTARQQWFGQSNAPGFQTLTVNDKLGDDSGIGAIFFNDKNGNTSQTGGKISYAKHLRMSSDYLSLNHVYLGISAGLAQTRLNETEFSLLPFDPTVGGTRQRDNYFNIDVGASYLKDSFLKGSFLKESYLKERIFKKIWKKQSHK